MSVSAIQQTVSQNYRRLGEELAAFVPRREQNFLVAEIVKTLCATHTPPSHILIAEAGTGIGKSLAYLQGALPAALLLKKKLVISTATLALQEQLVNKDLPLFTRISQQTFHYTLVKGRQRYACIGRLNMLAAPPAQAALDLGPWHSTPAVTDNDRALYQQMLDALQQGKWAGDRDSWPQAIDDDCWTAIASERHSCSPQFSGHQHCPFHLARRDLDKMDVLIVNHALLLADLALGGGIVLPPPEECFYIFDEAHHLPTIARDQAAATCGIHAAIRWLQNLPHLGDSITKLVQDSSVQRPHEQLNERVQCVLSEYQQLLTWFPQQATWFTESEQFRFEQGHLPTPLAERTQTLQDHFRGIQRALERLQGHMQDQLKTAATSSRRQVEAILGELGNALWRCGQHLELWHLLGQDKATGIAKWISHIANSSEYLLHAVPLEMGYWLDQQLWSRCPGAILVSATLTALNSFAYFRHQAGLPAGEPCRYVRLRSPFDYDRAELWVPDFPCDPQSPDFTETLARELPTYLKDQQASLVLFASWWQMKEVATRLRAMGWSLLVQGEASRSALLQLHKDRCDHNQPSILLGTGSFSEGLDLPGHLLTNLIITKLPFAIPDSPVEAALAETITLRGGNPFMQVTVPEASRKLVQACGRLIRKEQDAGRIVLLDRRLVTKRYGKALLDALPPFRRRID